MSPTPSSLQLSRDSGAPFELYKFEQSASVWAYTTREGTVIVDGVVYSPLRGLSRAALSSGTDRGDSTLEIVVPREAEVVESLITGASPEPMSITLFAPQRGSSEKVLAFFIGQVASIASDGAAIKLLCKRVQSVLEETIPREAIQVSCPHMLYDQNCLLDPASFTFSGTVSDITGREYTFTGLANTGSGSTYYQNGYLQFGSFRVFVEKQVNNILTVMSTIPTLVEGATVQAVAGCDRKATTCHSKANIRHYGGFPGMPGRNPWIVGLS